MIEILFFKIQSLKKKLKEKDDEKWIMKGKIAQLEEENRRLKENAPITPYSLEIPILPLSMNATTNYIDLNFQGRSFRYPTREIRISLEMLLRDSKYEEYLPLLIKSDPFNEPNEQYFICKR